MAVTSQEDLYKRYLEQFSEKQQEQIDQSNAMYEQQKKTVSDLYGGQISDTQKAYEDSYRENAVQRLINERKVAEANANIGLTDSGLNRTQQTAVQLSYANNKANIDRDRQTAVDALTREMTAKLSDLDVSRLGAESSIKDSYTKLAAEQAQKEYQAMLEQETARQKAQLSLLEQQQQAAAKSSYIIPEDGVLLSRNYTGTLEENGVSVYKDVNGNFIYVDNNSGKRTTVPAGTNPYTGTVNKDTVYGVMKSNGYQPDNVNGVKLTAARYRNNGATAKYMLNGNEQKIWRIYDEKTKKTTFYLWNGAENRYEDVTNQRNITKWLY